METLKTYHSKWVVYKESDSNPENDYRYEFDDFFKAVDCFKAALEDTDNLDDYRCIIFGKYDEHHTVIPITKYIKKMSFVEFPVNV